MNVALNDSGILAPHPQFLKLHISTPANQSLHQSP